MNKIRFSKGLGGLFTVIASLSTGCGGGAGCSLVPIAANSPSIFRCFLRTYRYFSGN